VAARAAPAGKGWQGDGLYVTFDGLCAYLSSRMKPRPIDPHKDGDSRGLIRKIDAPPAAVCTIWIDNAAAEDYFYYTAYGRGAGPLKDEFRGPSHKPKLPVDDYVIQIAHHYPDMEIVQVRPPAQSWLDLYEPCEVHYEKRSSRLPPTSVRHAGETTVEVDVRAEGAQVELHHTFSGVVFSGPDHVWAQGPHGEYQLRVSQGGVPLYSERLVVEPRGRVNRDIPVLPAQGPRQQLFNLLPTEFASRAAEVSGNLGGPATSWNLGLWLTLLGAARVFRAPSDFPALSALGLHSFDTAREDDSPIYVLAGLKDPRKPLQIGLGRAADVAWHEPRKVPDLDGVYQFFHPGPRGPQLVSFQVGRGAPVTFATYCLPNRVTLIILSEDETGYLRFHQYLLPIFSLMRHLPKNVYEYLEPDLLRAAGFMFLAQRLFARDRSPQSTGRGEWSDLTHNKWFDPVMSIIAAYDLIRQGRLAVHRGLFAEMVGNLRTYFGGIPDIEALALRADLPWQSPAGPPLLLDALRSFRSSQQRSLLPLPAAKLAVGSPWTSWLDAVPAPQSSLWDQFVGYLRRLLARPEEHEDRPEEPGGAPGLPSPA
jgi:hypothetical protein